MTQPLILEQNDRGFRFDVNQIAHDQAHFLYGVTAKNVVAAFDVLAHNHLNGLCPTDEIIWKGVKLILCHIPKEQLENAKRIFKLFHVTLEKEKFLKAGEPVSTLYISPSERLFWLECSKSMSPEELANQVQRLKNPLHFEHGFCSDVGKMV